MVCTLYKLDLDGRVPRSQVNFLILTATHKLQFFQLFPDSYHWIRPNDRVANSNEPQMLLLSVEQYTLWNHFSKALLTDSFRHKGSEVLLWVQGASIHISGRDMQNSAWIPCLPAACTELKPSKVQSSLKDRGLPVWFKLPTPTSPGLELLMYYI